MAEDSFRLFSPLTYYVNTLATIDNDVREAVLAKNQQKIGELSEIARQAHNVFICIDSNWHAFLLLIPSRVAVEHLPGFYTDTQLNDPFEVPQELFCWKCELRYEDVNMRTYEISFRMDLMNRIAKAVKKSFFIGQYCVGPKGMQIAAMKAAPHHYNAIINDCVEFSREMCLQLLGRSSNWREIEKTVEENIKQACATGLSIERLSRNSKSSGYSANFLLGGSDVSTFMSIQTSKILIVMFLLIYPFIVALLVKYVF